MKKILFAFLAAGLVVGTYSYKKGNELVKSDPPAIIEQEKSLPPVIVPKKDLTFEEASDLISKTDAENWLGYLTSDELEGRMSGKKGNKLAAEFCKSKFEEFGYKTEYQKFSIRRTNPGPKNEIGDDFSQNVIAIKPGLSEKIIIIGAHLDHVGYGPSMALDKTIGIHPGADDNASGTTGVLVTAKAMSKLPPLKHTIIFILFSGEEMGLIGSRHYVSQLSKDNLSKIDIMMNYDMIGHLNAKGNLSCVGARKTPKITNILMSLEPKYPPLKLEPKTGDGEGNSDHAPFYDKGIPVCFFCTGMHAQYHRVTDKADLINFNGLIIVSKLGMNLVYLFDSSM